MLVLISVMSLTAYPGVDNLFASSILYVLTVYQFVACCPNEVHQTYNGTFALPAPGDVAPDQSELVLVLFDIVFAVLMPFEEAAYVAVAVFWADNSIAAFLLLSVGKTIEAALSGTDFHLETGECSGG